MWTRTSYFARETMVSLRRNVLMTIAGIATVAVSLSLFGGILMLSKWVDHGTEKLKGGVTLEEVFTKLGKEGGMLGMSGVSPDMRDVERAAAEGNSRAKLALNAFVESVRSFIGSYLVALNGCDVLAFTGGIGENGIAIREAICRGMGWAGIELDLGKNQVRGKEERISKVESGVQIWIVPTNEELIVARQTVGVLTTN